MRARIRRGVGDTALTDPGCRAYIDIARRVHGSADTRLLNTLITAASHNSWDSERIERTRRKILEGTPV